MTVSRTKPMRWFEKLGSKAPQHRIGLSRVYILPTGFGLAYLVLCGLLFVLSRNQQSDAILLLSLLLFSLFLTALVMTALNLVGLSFSSKPTDAQYAGQVIQIPVELSAKSPKYQVNLAYQDGQTSTQTEVNQQEPSEITLLHPASQRGLFRSGPIKISSLYPFGLCRAWSWVWLEQEVLLWPALITHSRHLKRQVSPNHNAGAGVDEFAGLGQWQQGQSLAHVAWKQAARGGPRQIKVFEENEQQPTIFRLSPHLELEEALSQLATELVQANNDNQPFGLMLDQHSVAAGLGSQHLHQCLDILARYRAS